MRTLSLAGIACAALLITSTASSPLAAIPSSWRGIEEPPGAMVILRHETTDAEWKRFNIRGTVFDTDADMGNELSARGFTDADRKARGIIRQIDVAARGSNRIQVSFNATLGTSDPAVPADGYVETSDSGGITIMVPTRRELTQFYYRSSDGASEASISVRFDIYPSQ